MKRWWLRILWMLAPIVVLGGVYLWFFSPQVAAVMETRKIARRSPFVRMVPRALPDTSVSTAAGTKLAYLGYDFDVPWNDLDESRTKISPSRVVLYSQSGQVLMITSLPPREFVNAVVKDMKPEGVRQMYGSEALQSDYAMQCLVLATTPEKVTLFSSRQEAVRNAMLLLLKAISAPEDSGLFSLQTKDYQGFQWGDPQRQPRRIVADLYADDGGLELIFMRPKDGPVISQAGINRVLQTIRKTAGQRNTGQQQIATTAQ